MKSAFVYDGCGPKKPRNSDLWRSKKLDKSLNTSTKSYSVLVRRNMTRFINPTPGGHVALRATAEHQTTSSTFETGQDTITRIDEVRKEPNVVESQEELLQVKELYVPLEKKEETILEAEELVKLTLSELDLQWLHVLADGWAAPLEGFMKEDEYLQSLHFSTLRLKDDKERIGTERKVALCHPDFPGKPVAVLRNIEIFHHHKEERCARTFGITDPRHPYTSVIYESGDWLVGGKLEVLERIKYGDGLDSYRYSPRQLKEEFRRREADAVFVFQLRNPIHNGHALLMNSCREKLLQKGFKKPLLLVHQIGGKVKDDDVPLDIRIAQNEAILEEGILDPHNTIIGIFPSPMIYAGPKEVQWHAKARMNAGCKFYIVGRDPAGMKHPGTNRDMYDPWHGKKVLMMAPGLEKLEILPFQVAAYNLKSGGMEFFDSSRPEDFLFISGTKMRKFASTGEEPPAGFMGKKAWEILASYYQNKREDTPPQSR
ncbi:ATP sulfurylase 2 [Galdieria sulphuraria]|nr:ATP sulfurylase 2 [Galdieria sulphuraria]